MSKKLLSLIVALTLLLSSSTTVYAANGSDTSDDSSFFHQIINFFENEKQDQKPLAKSVTPNGDMIVDPVPKGAKTGERTVGDAPIERDTSLKVFDKKGKIIDKERFSRSKAVKAKSPRAKVVTAVIAADEEYRAAFPHWKENTMNIVEKQDKAFNRDHNIDIQVKGYMEWQSEGNNSGTLLEDLTKDSGAHQRTYDFVIGFTKDPRFDVGGIAWGGPVNETGISVTVDMNAETIHRVVQHELSHNFGLAHDYHGPGGPKCIMNYYYTHRVDQWDASHKAQISQNKRWYGTPANTGGNTKPQKPEKPSTKKPTKKSLSAYEKQVVRLVNLERKKRGLKPLKVQLKLSKVARLKSQDMRNNHYFSHHSPTYGSPFDMMRRYRITFRAAGENIAAGQSTPKAVMNAWMKSDGHRRNILNANFTHIGVGYAKGGSYGRYWTQQFISR
ncbi:CAP domain-containing protein [Salinithrix halophila]|uniref:CAP domain-containing protein n=1 Tax=Salinithrix halophila TaxID=1485204 RepID=A0ABV8JDW7_9BACL